MKALSAGIWVSVLFACCTSPSRPTPERVHVSTPPTWFEDGKSLLSVSGDGQWAIYRGRRRVDLIDLQYGARDPWRLLGSLDQVSDAVFQTGGQMARRGRRGQEQGWFLEREAGLQLSPLPPGAQLRWSADGTDVAYFEGDTVQVGAGGDGRRLQADGAVAAIAWARDGRAVYALVQGDSGLSSLVALDLTTGESRGIADNLDTSASHNSIDVSPDGRSVYVALAGPDAPDPELRHQPDADRDLDIYAVDTTTGDIRVVAQSPGDDLAPVVAHGFLYWTRNRVRQSVVVVPIDGGEARRVVAGGQIPSWRPDGTQLAYSTGGWRVADWALNIDAAVVDVDADGQTSSPRPIITGYHEDFTPVWSPDGEWMAYHSHRSPTAVSGYSSPGSTDDIYIKRDTAPMEEEIRLTDFGWEIGMADWSPDGRQLVFSSWDAGRPLINRPWIVTIDPQTGEALETRRLVVPDEVANAHWLAWSPTGNEIAIESVLDGEQRELWVVDPESGQGERVLVYTASTYGGLDWTPDGQSLVYSGLAPDERMQIFTVARSGGDPRQLSEDSANLMHPAVSPDGRLVACTRILWSKEIWRLRIDDSTSR